MLESVLYAIGVRQRWLMGCLIVIAIVGGTATHAALRGKNQPNTNVLESALETAVTELNALSIPTGDVAEDQEAIQTLVNTLKEVRGSLNSGLADKDDVDAAKSQIEEVIRTVSEWKSQEINLWRENRIKLLREADRARNALRQFQGALENSAYGDGNDAFHRRFFTDVRSIFGWATPWGTLAFFGFMYFLFFVPPAEWLKPLSSIGLRLRGLTVLGLSLDLSREKIQKDKTEIQSSLEIIQSIVRSHYRQAVQDAELMDSFKRFAKLAIPKLTDPNEKLSGQEFRTTIHVPFYIGKEDLFQIVNYVDVNGNELHSKAGLGRHFSTRFGIIGRAWREEKARYDPDVPTTPDKLVKMWGMTHEEATVAAQGKKTFLAVRLFDRTKNPLAVLYMDAKDAHLFDGVGADMSKGDIDDQQNIERAMQLESEFNELAERAHLRNKLEAVRDHVRWQMEGRVAL